VIRLIEALRYRSLLDVRQAIGQFHVLVGPNATGKSTFLDVVGLLGDLLTSDIATAHIRDVDTVERPEDLHRYLHGSHPQAVETVFQSLASTSGSQILCATHSPVFLSLARPEQILCFSTTERGDTDVVEGSRHPALAAWKREADLGTLFATGVLG
jgi:predicted ATPase